MAATWTQSAEDVWRALASLEGLTATSVVTMPPGHPRVLAGLAAAIGQAVPAEIAEVLGGQADGISFSWESEGGLLERSRGYLELMATSRVIAAWQDMQAVVEEIRRDELEGEGYAAILADWPHWLPIFRFVSGDRFCFDLRNGAIVLLEHDVMDGGPNVHGTVLAGSLESLRTTWSSVGFAELHDWSAAVDSQGIDVGAEPLRRIAAAIRGAEGA